MASTGFVPRGRRGWRQSPARSLTSTNSSRWWKRISETFMEGASRAAGGRYVQRMRALRGLSNRTLAEQIGISEGTIRNYLMYSQAVEVRSRTQRPRAATRRKRSGRSPPCPSRPSAPTLSCQTISRTNGSTTGAPSTPRIRTREQAHRCRRRSRHRHRRLRGKGHQAGIPGRRHRARQGPSHEAFLERTVRKGGNRPRRPPEAPKW